MKVSAAELARLLGVTSPRVSQYVKEGKLDGCFSGEARARRFEFEACVLALRARLDPDQFQANGSRTLARIDLLACKSGLPLPSTDQGHDDFQRLENARRQKVIEDAHYSKLKNQREEGRYVYAPVVAPKIAEFMSEERRVMAAFLLTLPAILAKEMGLTEAQQVGCEEIWAQVAADFLKRSKG